MLNGSLLKKTSDIYIYKHTSVSRLPALQNISFACLSNNFVIKHEASIITPYWVYSKILTKKWAVLNVYSPLPPFFLLLKEMGCACIFFSNLSKSYSRVCSRAGLKSYNMYKKLNIVVYKSSLTCERFVFLIKWVIKPLALGRMPTIFVNLSFCSGELKTHQVNKCYIGELL